MKITKKIIRDNEVVGYLLGDSAFPIPLPIRALYSSMYLPELVDAGYKFYDYAGKICDASGSFIVDLPPMDFSEVDEMEWMAGMDFASNAMSDAEASKYYTFDENVQEISFRAGNYTITTREQFIQYLNSVRTELRSFGFALDHRPINYFVAPEARFTLAEISEGGLAATYFEIINDRRTFKDYSDYEHLISFLISEGVLQSSYPTEGELIQAYYAWGPDGINAKCINQKFKPAVDGYFNRADDGLDYSSPEFKTVSNREFNLPIIQDNEMNIRYLRHTQTLRNVMAVEDFDRARLIIPNDSQLTARKRSKPTDYMYTFSGVGALSDVSDRIYFTLRSEDNFSYTYKASKNNIMLSLESGNKIEFVAGHNFRFLTQISNTYLSLDEVHSMEDYMLWNICIAQAAKYVQSRTTKPVCNNTYSMLMKVGMSPISAINYMVDRVTGPGRDEFESNAKVYAKYEGLKTTCIQLFQSPVPHSILDAFMLSPEEVSNVYDFVEKADVEDLCSRRLDMLENHLKPDMPGYDYTFILDPKERMFKESIADIPNDALFYYSNAKFVIDAMSGTIAIDALGDGINEDAASAHKLAATIIMSLIYQAKGDNPSVSDGLELIESLEHSRYCDIYSLFKIRDNAYKGYLLDYSTAVEKAASMKNIYWMYANKTFRELSNKPIDKTRPWLLEVICMDSRVKNDKTLMEICCAYASNAIESIEFENKNKVLIPAVKHLQTRQIIKPAFTYGDLLKRFEGYLASELFFKILGIKLVDGNDTYTVNFTLSDLGLNIPIEISSQVVSLVKGTISNDPTHIKYISIFDYNKMEYEEGVNGRGFIYHMVNANVDMWNVKPKKGYKINMVPLAPSYYRAADLNTIGGLGYKEGLQKNGIAIQTDLMDVCTNVSRIVCHADTTWDKDIIRKMYIKVRDTQYAFMLDEYDSFGSEDYIFVYMKKWALLSKGAKTDNLICEHMPHRSDIFWSELAPMLNMEAPSRVPTYKYGVNNALLEQDVQTIRWDPNLSIETKATGISLQKVIAGDITANEFIKIYVELALNNKYVDVSSNYITTPDGITYLAPAMSQADVNALLGKYAIRLNNFVYIVTLKGIYRLEGV